MKRHVAASTAFIGAALAAVLGGLASNRTEAAQNQKSVAVPIFEVDYKFPTMPGKMLLGGVGGATADSHGNVWVFHRPHTLEEGNATENGWGPAPPVVEFSPDGKYLQGWGGPSKTGEYQWFNRGGLYSAHVECQSCSKERRTNGDGRPGSGEHGIFIDANDSVWLTGNGDGDGHILKFTKDGKFLLQIGKGGVSADSNDTTHLSRPASLAVFRNEVFVADGYGNRRIVVFDANTGAYKRHWGAYGKKPDDSYFTNAGETLPGPFSGRVQNENRPSQYDPNGPPPPQFRIVHAVRISRDGFVYVCDRTNDRLQVFRKDGTFVQEAFIAKETFGSGSVWDVGFSIGPEQTFLIVIDGTNQQVYVLRRKSLEIVNTFGGAGHWAGQFYGAHNLAVDSHGNLFITETYEGKRVQKFLFKGLSAPAGGRQ